MKTLVIYHKEDNDGVFSGAIIKLAHTIDNDVVETLGMDYNDIKKFETQNQNIKRLKDKYDYICITDVSFSVDFMSKLLAEYGNKFEWIDHHKPIIVESENAGIADSIQGIRDIKHSAIYNAYKYYFDYNESNMPELYKILSAYDSWTFKENGYKQEYVTAINKAVIDIYDLNIDKAYKEIVSRITHIDENKLIDSLYKHGLKLIEYDDKRNANICKNVDMTWTIDGRKSVAMTYAGGTSSTMFKTLADKVDHAIVFKMIPDGKFILSLYNLSDDVDFDCGQYLKTNYGGGGHKGAAGCTIDTNTFIEMLKTHKV